jgi:putative ABC transport system permease protein
VLLAGAGVMIRSLLRLNSINLGFNPTGVTTMRVYARDAQMEFYQQLLERVRPLPGVEAVSVSSSAPLNGYAAMSTISIEGQPEAEDAAHFVGVHSVAPDHFKTLGITLLTGRGFTEQDRIGTKRVGIINRASAERFFPDQEAIGKRIKISLRPDYPNAEAFIEIIGIADNVKYGKPEEVTEPDVYLSYLQPVDTPSQLIIRASGDRASLIAAVRREVRALDKNMPVYGIQTMDERAAEVTSRTRFSALLLALFAGLALVLSAIGIYGVIAYSVAQRTREIGIRMALGARASNVFRLVLSQGILLTLVGLIIGLIAAYATTRVLASQLYDVSATDPATFAVISLLLAMVALAACYIPARRAMKVDPMVALRYE